jgi:hypothetical protein
MAVAASLVDEAVKALQDKIENAARASVSAPALED